MKFTNTNIGDAIIVNRELVVLDDQKHGTNGTIGLGILLNVAGEPECFALFWQWGGDWSGFGDDARYDMDLLDGWEPGAIPEAVAEAIQICPDCEDDMEWFLHWAADAEVALSARNTADE